MQVEREDAERRRIEMMKKEIQYRESDNIKNIVKNAESKINQIVDKGQQVLYEKKHSREDFE